MHGWSGVAGLGSAVVVLTMAGAGLNPAAAAEPVPAPPGPLTLEAEAARLNPTRIEVVEQATFPSKQGVALRDGQSSNTGAPDSPPDLVFTVKAPQAGRYWLRTHAATDAKGTEAMRQAAGKGASLRLLLSVAGGRPTRRVVFVPWSPPGSCTQALGKYGLSGQEQEIRVWLPEGMRLDYLQITPYVAPKVPAAAAAYQPKVVPPPSRPRLWANAESLPQVRANLDKGENAALWARVREQAAKPFELKLKPNTGISYDSALESAVVNKAFVSLMAGDQARGREAVELSRSYLAAVEFDNLLDITREIGRAIYSGALVYDWCYDLMTPAERDSIRQDLMRLADDMEIGWPPFQQMIVNGHGNEAQVNRDLLCMAIAIYDEDPQPYRYCAYRILEELVPMRAFEYQSPRHNQGVSYGPYRFNWDLHAAWLFRRMTGRPVFNDNLAAVYPFWLYLRLPGNQVLRDGDGFSDGRTANLGATPLLSYAYSNDPVIKGDFERQGGLPGEPLLVLLLNDPALPAEKSLDGLPLTRDFGPILGSMVARTGWNLGRNRADVVVEMKGGGYHFGNHQHADAGSFQIYYRGLQATDLGQYHFYGTPYDSNFCKRSVAHSMLLVVDPDEKFGVPANDGGTRSVRTCPTTPEQALRDPLFANGTVLSASFGPSPLRPFFSTFAVDLKSAYSRKIQDYVRTFCFLNLGNEQTPAVLIVLDTVTSAKPEFRKYWQVNTLNPPEQTVDGVILRNRALGLAGKVSVRMLRPAADAREVEILSGAAANSVFGQAFTPPFADRPEANGHRVLFSPKAAQASTVFLTVLSMADEAAPELPVALAEGDAVFVLTLADRVVALSKTGTLLEQPFEVEVPADRADYQLLLTGLAPRVWGLRREDGKVQWNARVDAGRNSAFVVVPGGRYRVQPEALAEAAEFKAGPDLMPAPAATLAHGVFLDGQALAAPPTKAAGSGQLLPAIAIFKALGHPAVAAADGLRLQVGERRAVFTAGANDFELNGLRFRLPSPAAPDGAEWFVPDSVLAALLDRDLGRDAASTSADLTRSRFPGPVEVLWIEATPDPDPLALRAMLADVPGRQEYWAAEGREVRFDLVLTQPRQLRGVGIKWHQGATRQAKFAVETSADRATWKRVFEGASSGTASELETYAFEPHPARFVRFLGFGNTVNAWNSIVHFRVLSAEAGKGE
jgi:heparin/heparan-sulfate lyase